MEQDVAAVPAFPQFPVCRSVNFRALYGIIML